MFTQHRNLFALGLALASLLLLGGRVTAAVSVGDRTGAAPTQGGPAAPFAGPTSSCSTASFGPATDFAVGGSPQAVAVGDFNRDGNPDLAVANSSVNTVSVRLGNGTGGFGAATIFFEGFYP
jgi:hypothetical protein